MPVTVISKPICSACSAPLAQVKPLIFCAGRSLGNLCPSCNKPAEGQVEAIFHAFGGMRDNKGTFEPKEPYYLPQLTSVAELREVAFTVVRKNSDLLRFLDESDQAILAEAA